MQVTRVGILQDRPAISMHESEVELLNAAAVILQKIRVREPDQDEPSLAAYAEVALAELVEHIRSNDGNYLL